ncbi:MAG: XRE family transcriptional regulator [Candidatus Omnitrophota bacterium]|jgi:ribosome-binding protein aMBF1 (putative translation factor)|nr:MAG: XRE family transcriptional regulator [Candidatus Omnitrophota bacterium]
MIKNERQYKITKTQTVKFTDALHDLVKRADIDPFMRQLEEDALKSQLQELNRQIQEYDELRSGTRNVIKVDSIDQLPKALIQARIASGFTQKELADLVGLKMQQIQRYESTDYASANLSRIKKIVDVLGVTVRIGS